MRKLFESVSEQEGFVNKFLEALCVLAMFPVYGVHILQAMVDRVRDLNREEADRFYLKRINMTEEQFDHYMNFVCHEQKDFKALMDRLSHAEDVIVHVLNMPAEYGHTSASRHYRLYNEDFPYRVPKTSIFNARKKNWAAIQESVDGDSARGN